MKDPPSVVGCSGTSLTTKLGINESSRLALLDAPADLPLELPPTVVVRHQARGHADIVLAFFVRADRIERRLDRLASMIFPSGAVWIAWPKRTSGVETDLSDGAVRDIALRRGLVDNKVCAIDETWSALRFAWRREHRGPGPTVGRRLILIRAGPQFAEGNRHRATGTSHGCLAASSGSRHHRVRRPPLPGRPARPCNRPARRPRTHGSDRCRTWPGRRC